MNQDELQNTVLCGDALEMLKRLPDECVQMCVTSPPYYGLRDYGAEGQIGCEQTPFEYIDRLTEIFREVRRVLKSNGTLWLNIADSYAGSGKGVWSKSLAERPKSKQTYHSLNTDENAALPKKWDGIKEKDMIGIPWQLAFALRADGWYLRSDIIWQKPNCLPEAVKDRPTKSYEHIFLLSKSPHYYYDAAAISEPVAPVTVERNKRAVSDRTKYAKGVGGAKPQALFLPRSHSDIPFLLLSKAAGEVFAEFKRNEDKFFKRMQRDDSYGFDDGTTELYNAGICVPDFTGELFEEEKDSRIVWAAFARLTPTQKKYVRQHLFGGKTFTRIAKDEGKSIKTVQEAYIAAIKKMKKFLKTPSNLDS